MSARNYVVYFKAVATLAADVEAESPEQALERAQRFVGKVTDGDVPSLWSLGQTEQVERVEDRIAGVEWDVLSDGTLVRS